MGLEPTTTGITILSLWYLPVLNKVDTININQQLTCIILIAYSVSMLIEIRLFSVNLLTSIVTSSGCKQFGKVRHGKGGIHGWQGQWV